MLPRLWALFLLLLVAVTSGLWLIPAGETEMPLIPLVSHGIDVAGFASIVPSITLIVGLLLVAADRLRSGPMWWLVAGSLTLCFLVDQHRLQPWAYQSAIYAVVFATMDRHNARRWLIPLAASVYVFSAAGKFDFQFAHTVGQDFLETISLPLGGLPENLSQSARATLAMIFPATELLAGIGLLFRPLRPIAAVVVILMHVSLIAVLGPWGLDHSTGVLAWNMLLIVQAYLLMLKPELHPQGAGYAPRNVNRADLGPRFAQAVVVVALVAPLFERSGFWDHWTSWSLYSPHTSRVDIELHRSAMDTLDPAVRPFLDKDTDGDGWHELAINRWSLESRGAPIYPQARYQLALAAEIAKRNQLGNDIRVRLKSVSDRWTGRRREHLMLGRGEINDGLKFFWLTR